MTSVTRASDATALTINTATFTHTTFNVASAQTIPWRGVQVQERFADLAPAVVEADSRAAAFCEAKFGAGRNLRIFLYVTIGTGIGSSLVLDGVPYAGAHGSSGTLASIVTCEKSFTASYGIFATRLGRITWIDGFTSSV